MSNPVNNLRHPGFSNAVILIGPFKISVDNYHAVDESELMHVEQRTW